MTTKKSPFAYGPNRDVMLRSTNFTNHGEQHGQSTDESSYSPTDKEGRRRQEGLLSARGYAKAV